MNPLVHEKKVEFKIPTTYKEARRMIQPYVIQKKTYQACINDCMIFKTDEDKNKLCTSLKRKQFLYLPIGPRLARYFGEENLAKLLQAHAGSAHTNLGMWDIHDSPIWKKLYSEDGFFGGCKNGISFAFEVDGVNPFHNIQ